jgi:LPXTG-motif cell wall-anchored protein
MRILKALKVATVSMVSVMMLAGCASLTDTKMVINSENDIDASITVAYNKEKVNGSDEWKSLLDEGTKNKPANVVVKDYETKEYIGRTYTLENKTLAEQQEWVLGSTKGGTLVKKDGKYIGDFPFSYGDASQAEHVYFSVTTPGSITSAPGAVIDGNTATWDFKTYSGDIKFEGKDSNPLAFVLGFLAVGLLAGGILFFVFRRKQSSAPVQATPTSNTAHVPSQPQRDPQI